MKNKRVIIQVEIEKLNQKRDLIALEERMSCHRSRLEYQISSHIMICKRI